MGLTLYDIVKPLLSEGVSDDAVIDAIHNKYHVKIKYDDGGDDSGNNPKGSRVIQPMAIGRTKKGFPVVRAFQVNGNSRRGAPRWKFFRLDRIKSWLPMRKKKFFNLPDESFGKYNFNGDKTMGTFIDNAKFDDMSDTLSRERAKTQTIKNAPKISTKNVQGPIDANQQWKKNVFTSQPNSERYKQYAKNIKDTEDDINRFDDDIWAAAERERDAQNEPNRTGPINNSYEDEYDINDVDFNENDFIKNTNRK